MRSPACEDEEMVFDGDVDDAVLSCGVEFL
jgi:hypothetical protein